MDCRGDAACSRPARLTRSVSTGWCAGRGGNAHRAHGQRPGRGSGAVNSSAFYVDLLATVVERPPGSDLWAAISTDGIMRLPARRIADAHANGGGAKPSPPSSPGAARGPKASGIAVLSRHRPAVHVRHARCRGVARVPQCGQRRRGDVSRDLMHAIAEFAASGSPSAPSGGAWPRYETAQAFHGRLRSRHAAPSMIRLRRSPRHGTACGSPACRAPALDLS